MPNSSAMLRGTRTNESMNPRLLAALAASIVLVAIIVRSSRRARAAEQADATASPPSEVKSPAAAPVAEPTTAAPPQPSKADKPSIGEAAAPGLTIGAHVRLTGLGSKPELNGQYGRIVCYDEAKGRFNISLAGGKVLQIKPANLIAESPPDSQLSVADLVSHTLARHDALTPARAARVVELLRAPGSPVEAGCLLRCCCCIDWVVPATRDVKTGTDTIFTFVAGADATSASATSDKGMLLFSDARLLAPMRALNAAPSGSEHSALLRSGTGIFNPKSLDGIAQISLDPQIGDSAASSRFTALPSAYFPPLCHMSEAIALEATLGAMAKTWGMAPDSAAGTAAAPAEALQTVAAAFAKHTFFCFNASPNAAAGSIVPITANMTAAASGGGGLGGGPTSWILLYTCEMVLEHARPHLTSLGAFAAAKGANVGATAVPAASVLASLQSAGCTNAGVHVNEFVPGIAPSYKALGLSTEALVEIFKLAGAGAEGGTVV